MNGIQTVQILANLYYGIGSDFKKFNLELI
jgi:hypothetical protein